jgi:hypothetical protein
MSLLDPMRLPCGGTAYFDESSGISYRCETCMAVVGSMGMPDHCKQEAEKWRVMELLGGKGWDYLAEAE